jgi:hypothetical protein
MILISCQSIASGNFYTKNFHQFLAIGWWFSLGAPVSSTNKTDCHNIIEIILKVALKHHKPPQTPD